MKKNQFFALLLALSLFAGLTGCARKSRRPALPAAPLQSAFAADTGGGNSAMRKSAVSEPVVEQTTKALLDEFTRPLENEDALYQDYTTEHRSQYKMLRQRPEEVIGLVLPELLSDVTALECYSDETSRATLLYCLLKDTLQNEPFSWDGDSYRRLSDMLAEFIQFVSEKELTQGDGWFTENAPLTGLCAAVMKSRPALRLNMTPCAPMTNAQALSNAKRVFAAALDEADAEAFGFDAWPENFANGFDVTTQWTLSQAQSGAVTLAAADPDTKEETRLTYTPNAAELHSILSGYGALELTKPDGETISLRSLNADRGFTPASDKEPVQDYELALENGVETGMDCNTVLALIGTPHRTWSDTMAGMGMESRGVLYAFGYDENLVMRLQQINFRLANDTFTGTDSELPAAREIRLRDTMQSVFDKLPDGDKTLKKWAWQEIYTDETGAGAYLQFVADSYYALNIRTPGGRVLSITFARADNSVKWMDIS